MSGKKRHPVSKAKDATMDFLKQMVGSKESLNELIEVLGSFDKLRQDARQLLKDSERVARVIPRKETGSLSIQDKVFGYEKEYAYLLSKLEPEGSLVPGRNTAVIAIIGHGGTGKTELARRAFNDQKNVRDKFDLPIWACFYAKFTEIDLLREIWKSAFGREPVGEMNVTSLQKELVDKVEKLPRSRRYLLVLDDVCNDEGTVSELSRKKTWEEVLAPFKQHGGRGSRILMTTRAHICSRTLGADASIVLHGMDTSATTLLLKHKVFRDENATVNAKLKEAFNNENVRKLHGSPLAAEEVGCLLSNHGREKWKETLHLRAVLEAHMSSYQDLPPQLQRCLAFCSIFPLNRPFDPEKLIKMWIAHGFASNETVAREYLEALLQRSLFQPDTASNQERPRAAAQCYYRIHEHIHLMLRHVCPGYYHSIDGGGSSGGKKSIDVGCGKDTSILERVRHLSVSSGCVDKLSLCPEMKKLRTLLIFNDDASSSSSTPRLRSLDEGILKKFKGVRVLDLSETSVAQVPESIAQLKHLRYLGLPSSTTRLGSHVTKLLLLQTLSIARKNMSASKNCKLDKFPDDMSSLIHLKHLDMDTEYIAQIAGIGAFKELQCSVEFQAGRTEEGHGMKELQGLNSLRGTLSIKGLETVKGREEAEEAALKEKQHVRVLMLEWNQRRPQPAETSAAGSVPDVLEGLQPHSNLEKLHIRRYVGTTAPAWLADATVMQNLRSLYLRNCRNLQALPPVGGLPRLKLLSIKELNSVERIDPAFYARGSFQLLEKMELDDMPRLIAWDALSGDAIHTPILFPMLREVVIVDCPKLVILAGLLHCRTSLTCLRVQRCPEVNENFPRSSFPSLTERELHKCSGLRFEG